VTDAKGNILDVNGEILKPDQFGAWPDPQPGDFNTDYELKNDKNYQNLPLYDHLSQAFRKAVTNISTINVSGGGEKSDYSLTASYFNQQNVLNNTLKRINLGSNIGFELFKGFTLRSISQFVIQDEDLLSGTYSTNRIINIDPLFQASNNNRFLLINSYPYIDFNNRNSSGYLTLKPKQQENALNPLSEREWHEHFSKTNRLVQNINANYKINRFVELDYKYGVEIWNTDYNDFYKNQTGVPQATSAFWGSTATGSLRTDYVKTTFQNSLATLYVKTDFQQDFNLKVPIKTVTQASYDWRKFDYRSTYSKGSGLPAYPPYTIASAAQKDAGDYYQTGVTYGMLFNQTIDYGNYGGITGGFRTDYSSEFGEASKAFTFYRGTAYFRPKELFRSNVITDWKLRGAYGESGIQPSVFNGDYYARQLTLTVTTLGQGGVALAYPITANNSALRVQVTKELEVGTDISFRTGLNNWLEKISLSGSYWKRQNNNIIQQAPLSLSTGAGSKIDNLIDIQSNGLDLSLDADMYHSENFSWDMSVRFGRAKSKVTNIFGGQSVVNGVFALIPGQNIGGFYTVTALKSIDQLRPDKTHYIDPADADKYEVVNGMVVDKTTKRVQLTDPNDVSVVGNAYPKFNMSFINNITLFKDLNISFQLDWYQGNSIYNMTKQWLYRDRIHADFDKPVTINGETGAFVNFYNSLYNSVQRTGWFVENGSLLRLRDVTLTYNLTKLIKQKWVKGISLTAGARNLFTITKYSGLDPEATSAQDSQGNISTGVGAIKGVDYFAVPNLKSYLLGINIDF
ncbi:MAG: hypothetical protein HYR66_13165, partial [Sphingobacteriales bacterium]|nr:hypothetical protein [Sphingobacteriales bacterium]